MIILALIILFKVYFCVDLSLISFSKFLEIINKTFIQIKGTFFVESWREDFYDKERVTFSFKINVQYFEGMISCYH